MSLRNQGLTKAFQAGAAVAPNRFIKFGADDRTMVQAAAAADFVVGASDDVGCASGERFDGIFDGIVTVDFGGTVTRGAQVMSDANGKAITAAASAGANVRTAGIAMASAVSGDKAPVLLIPGSFQG